MSEGDPRAARLRDMIRPNAAAEGGDQVVQRALEAVRTHLGLQVAYVSEFVGNETILRQVDAPGLEHLIKPGDSRSLDDVYCRHILAGDLPQLIADTTSGSRKRRRSAVASSSNCSPSATLWPGSPRFPGTSICR